MDSSTPEQAFILAIRRASSAALGLEPASVPLSYPPGAEMGDLATPVCFELARVARRPPRALAEALVAAFVPGSGIARVEAAGGGYINAFLDRDAFLKRWMGRAAEGAPAAEGPKIIVEHTNINPNKAAHIGHLRNAVLGDTLVRCLRRLGRRVEVQNYIDDTGVQVADLVVGFQVLRKEGLAEVKTRYAEEVLRRDERRFDYIAWDLYAEVTRFYEEDPQRLAHRESTLQAMEEGDNPTAALAAHLSQRMVAHHLRTMKRIDVAYDLLPKESDVLAHRFWNTAFERLVAAGAIVRIAEGKHAGCWVMQLAGVEEGAGEDEKVIVRSNGTVTYVGKDIAYQLWKFGLLGRDFQYRRFAWSGGEPLYETWSTCPDAGEADAPRFGEAQTVYNVIDARQSYLQRVVSQGLRSLGHAAQADRSIHYSYEMVALTPSAVATMFPDHVLNDEARAKPYLEMSGRKGLGVRADDLLDKLFERACSEIRVRSADLPAERVSVIARQIMVAALRYYMLRFSRSRVVAFDLDAALAFEGETGPYLQYSVVRARNILAKVAEKFGPRATDPAELADRVELGCLEPGTATDHWNLALQLSRVDATLAQAIESLELAAVAKHAYVLAQSFNSFYHRYPVLQEADEGARTARIALVHLYHGGMVQLLLLMGIETPDRM